jgi:biopolymer transport protein ExbB
MSLLEFFSKGGILMYPILLCSLIAVVVIIERYLVLRRANTDAGQFMLKLRSVLQKNDVAGAINFCSKMQAPIANIMRRGLTKYVDGPERVREAIENAGKEEAFKLEHRLGLLGSIAGIAPLLGFLGTVTGMIGAFRTIQELSGAANPSDLAGGIWEALITTAFGLIVGIFSYGMYNYYVTRVNRTVFEMEIASEEFIDLVRSGKLEPSTQGTAPESGSGARTDDYFSRKS